MRELLQRPVGGERAWKRLYYAFGLDDPRNSPEVQLALSSTDRAACERFVDHSQALAETTFLGANDRMDIGLGDDGRPTFNTQLSAPDITTGFMTMFRQCFADDENASFLKVRTILSRALTVTGDTEALGVLQTWRQVHAKLLTQSLEEHVQERMVARGELAAEFTNADGSKFSPIVRSPDSPKQMLQTVWYSGQIHWGKYRDALAAISSDPWKSGEYELSARQSAIELTHFYLGFALLVQRALSGAVDAGAGSD
jgi:hypothetical protein